MSSRYQQEFTIPDGFPALLKDFTREILRNQVRDAVLLKRNLPNGIYMFNRIYAMQPSNLFAFGAQYFAEKRSQNAVETKQEEPELPVEQDPRASAFERAVVAENYQELSEAVYGKAVDLLCVGLVLICGVLHSLCTRSQCQTLWELNHQIGSAPTSSRVARCRAIPGS